jgi:hypothetical protein
MTDSWDFYFCHVDDALASIYLNLGIHERAPEPGRPCLFWVWLQMLEPQPDGLSSNQEFERLVAIEDALTAALTPSGALLVGRSTTQGRREFYYYAPSADGLQAVVDRSLRAFRGYRAETGAKHDPQWSQYFDFLYPAPAQQRQIDNRRTIEAIEKEGDTLVTPRPVSHFLYFPTTEARTGFLDTISPEGFRVVPGSLSTHSDQPRPYGVQLERSDP